MMIDQSKVKEIAQQLTPAQLELLETIAFNGASSMAQDFMLIHDIALYHSDYSIDAKEKTALYQLKQLAEMIKQIAEEIG
jgi:hypothetical protein